MIIKLNDNGSWHYIHGEAAEWADAGFSAVDAWSWREAGLAPFIAARWRGAGFNHPGIATDWHKAGFDPDQAKALEAMGHDAVTASEAREMGTLPDLPTEAA